MKFAENNRISHRQLYRQIVMVFLAPFLLCLFGKGKINGISGLAGTVAALIVLGFYVIFLIRLGPGYAALSKNAGGICGRLAAAFFLVYVLLTAAFLLQILREIIPVSVVTGISGEWFLVLTLLVCSFGVHKGMQRRGRIAEVSGGLVLTAVILMLLLSVGQGKWEYLQEMLQDSSFTETRFLRSWYGILCAFSGLSLLPFALENVEKQGSAGKTVILAVGTVGVLLLVLEVVLPAVFGQARLTQEEYPVLPLLAGADLPGNYLARFDILWMGFLLYSMFFSIGSLFHYGSQIIGKNFIGSGRFWMPAAVYLLSVMEFQNGGIEDYYGDYVGCFFVPGMLALQIFLSFLFRGKWKKRMGAVAVFLAAGVLFLSGCAGVEPEKRIYPLALGVDVTNGNFVLTYGTPDMSKATGQGKKGEDEGDKVLSIEGRSFREIEETYSRTQDKYLDLGHLQILILGEGACEKNYWTQVMDYLAQEPFVGENVCIFQTQNAKELVSWRSAQDATLGEYLPGLMENNPSGNPAQAVTLRDLYYARYDSGELPHLPKIWMEGEGVEVWW